MNESEAEEDGNWVDAMDPSKLLKWHKRKEKKKALKVREENEGKVAARWCPKWINAFDEDIFLDKTRVANEQRPVTVYAGITPSVNSALMFGQSEFVVTIKEWGKRVAEKRKKRRSDDHGTKLFGNPDQFSKQTLNSV